MFYDLIYKYICSKRKLLYISDGAGWALDWVGQYILKYFPRDIDYKVEMTNNLARVKKARNSKIHFGSRYALLDNANLKIHKSNEVSLTWFHGNYKSGDPYEERLFELLKEWSSRLTCIVTSCEASKEELMKAGIEESKITIIPIGIDLKLFKPFSEADREKQRKLLNIPENSFCIGSFQKDGKGWGDGMEPKLIKGPDLFVETIARLKVDIPDLCVLLTGPSRGYVKSQLDKLGVPYYHQYLDEYEDIALQYHALDVYLITSRCEGGPQGFMESWASGIPVVSSKMGMPADYIKHGDNGMMCENEDVDAMVKSILELYHDKEKCSTLANNGLKDVDILSWKKVSEQYVDFLLLDSK